MTLNRERVFQTFKYVVYALLAFNVYLFFAEEWAAASHRFVAGINLPQVIEAFAASIDTAAWVLLLLMFELETYVLDDRQITPKVSLTLRVVRAICYAFIVYAFYGYLVKLFYLYGANALPGVNDLCSIADGAWAYAIDLDEYTTITTNNCQAFSSAESFLRFPGISAVVDGSGYQDILKLAWVDVINAGVWLLVVIVLEFDVKMQNLNRLSGKILHASNFCKYVLYSILLLAAIYWGFKGDFVDFWDAFLWLVAFVFIELNVFEWRQETLPEVGTA